MPKFNSELYQEKYRIKSNRLPDYDYSNPGNYFITICTKNRIIFFGNVINNKIILNKYGHIVKQNLLNIDKRFNNVLLDKYVIMPNHVHIIFIIVSIDLNEPSPRRNAINRVSTGGITGKHNPMLNKTSLGYIVRSFKSVCTKQIHELECADFAWQSNYYEHIIRDNKLLQQIREYIKNNPRNWIYGRNNIN